jgi:hypothetical protein
MPTTIRAVPIEQSSEQPTTEPNEQPIEQPTTNR